MRDIRPDLKERLARNEAARSRLSAELKRLEAYAASVIRMIEVEDERYADEPDRPAQAIADFILDEAIKRPVSKEDLRFAAQAHGYTSDGRSIHAHVTNLVRAGRLDELEPGMFRARPRSAEPPDGSSAEIFPETEVTAMPQ